MPLPGGAPLQLGARTLVMGILNVTPDSFADGGRALRCRPRGRGGLRMAAEGADIIDVGGESTRPGAEPLPADEELRRVLPVVERLAAETSVPLSIDTYKAVVAREAVARGAAIVNDISGLQYDPELGRVAAEAGAALVLMHTRGRSRDMYERAVYEDAASEVAAELRGGGHAGGTRWCARETPSSSIPGWASRSAPSTASTCWRSSIGSPRSIGRCSAAPRASRS